MSRPSRPHTALALVASGALAAGALATGGLALLPASAGAASGAQTASAKAAGAYLAGQISTGGFVPTAKGAADVGDTVRAALGMATARTGSSAFSRAVAFLTSHVDDQTLDNGAVRPGATGLLVVVAVAAGKDPRAFGGTDLVARILSAQVPAGVDAGEFQDPAARYPGVLNHSLALLGLAAAGLPSTDSHAAGGLRWLAGEQCADGGWQNDARTSTAGTLAPCDATMEDSQTSGYAVQALTAFGRAPASSPTAFFGGFQNTDGGYGYFAGNTSDSDSTGIVGSALAGLGIDTDGLAVSRGGNTPAGWLRSIQVPAGQPAAGSYKYDATTVYDPVYGSEEALPGELGTLLPRGVVVFDDAPVPPAPTASPSQPPGSPPPAGPVAGATVPRPFCAVVLSPQGRKIAVPAGCLPGTAGQTTCTVVLDRSFRKGVVPAGCLPLKSGLTPCSTVRDRNRRKSVLPKGCLPLFPSRTKPTS